MRSPLRVESSHRLNSLTSLMLQFSLSVVRGPARNSVRSSVLRPLLFALCLSRRSLVRRRISVFLFAYMNDELQSRTEPRVGPEFLSNLWDEHMRHEFATHNTEDTLATMVDDAYVNHIPVLTGGVGKDALREFYSKRFIPQMPPDTEVTPVSRTIGADQLVDEMRSEERRVGQECRYSMSENIER